ncbi:MULTISPECIES: MFS transporter [unclassified Microbacterium]|uniref:MFS transporter n=1 Tax=unclassified Microbacterium TaxID=2609290 RepID=UPI00301B0B98
MNSREPVVKTAVQRPTPDQKEVRRVLLSGYLGSAIEFYDFLLYGTAAAIVFGPVFFTDLPPLVATIASFGTFAAGYIARPLGGLIFGHFGDRYGRKKMLMITMIMMGLASTLIGLIPTPDLIGWLAPVLLIVLRVVQGIALGGEWGGAMLMAVEHADQNRRALYGAAVTIGAPTGTLLASLMLALFGLLPNEDFLAWGWRIPFLLSAALLLVGVWVRKRVSESPLFVEALEREGAITSPPLLHVLRHEWRPAILTTLVAAGPLAVYIVGATFMQTYMIGLGFDKSLALVALAIANASNLVWYPLCAYLSDRVGRKPMLLAGFIGSIIAIGPVFLMVQTGHPVLIVLGFWLIGSLLAGPIYGPLGAFISEQFGTQGRYTGASLGYQLGAALGSGLTPIIATSLFAATGGTDVLGVVLYMVGVCVVSMVCVLLSRETKSADISG